MSGRRGGCRAQGAVGGPRAKSAVLRGIVNNPIPTGCLEYVCSRISMVVPKSEVTEHPKHDMLAGVTRERERDSERERNWKGTDHSNIEACSYGANTHLFRENEF